MYKPPGLFEDEIKLGHLLGSLARRLGRRADQLMDQTGLYRGQAILLVILSTRDGLTHSEIAEKLTISPPAVTKVIQRLEASGYLERRSDKEDERISRVFLLDEGRAEIQKIKQVFAQIESEIFTDFSAEEQEILIRLLLRVYQNLAEQP